MYKHTVIAESQKQKSELELPLYADEEVWLEFGFTTDTSSKNMLWYNEGRIQEIGNWTRKLCAKVLTNEPKGEMYFLMRSRGVEHCILVGD